MSKSADNPAKKIADKLAEMMVGNIDTNAKDPHKWDEVRFERESKVQPSKHLAGGKVTPAKPAEEKKTPPETPPDESPEPVRERPKPVEAKREFAKTDADEGKGKGAEGNRPFDPLAGRNEWLNVLLKSGTSEGAIKAWEVRHRKQATLATPEQVKANAASGATPVSNKIQGGGAVGGQKLTFADGSKVMYKANKETSLATNPILRPDMSNDEATEADREVASKTVDDLFGFDIQPATERTPGHKVTTKDGTRVRNPGEGSDQAFVDAHESFQGDAHNKAIAMGRVMTMIEDLDAGGVGAESLHQMAALDFITGQTDRHLGNLIKGTDGRYYAIDNGLALHSSIAHVSALKSLPMDLLQGKEIHPSVKESITNMTSERLRGALESVGTPDRLIRAAEVRLTVAKEEFVAKGRWPAWGMGKSSQLLNVDLAQRIADGYKANGVKQLPAPKMTADLMRSFLRVAGAPKRKEGSSN